MLSNGRSSYVQIYLPNVGYKLWVGKQLKIWCQSMGEIEFVEGRKLVRDLISQSLKSKAAIFRLCSVEIS